jgi:hypothetical protein
MDNKTLFWIQGVYMIPFIVIISLMIFTCEFILMLIFMGWTMPFSLVAMFAGILVEGNNKPWTCKRKWIRVLAMPFLKSHALFCNIQGIKQQI